MQKRIKWVTTRRKRGCRGASAMEFALWVPVLALVMVGSFDLGNQVQVATRLEHAVRAGAQMAFVAPSDEDAIRQAVLMAWPGLTAAEVSVICHCGNTAQACTANCASTQARTIHIAAIRNLVPLLLPTANRSEGHATVRLG